MRKLQIEDAEVMRIAIQQEIGRSERPRSETDLCCRSTCANTTEWIWGHGNAKGCFGRWGFGFASTARKSLSPIH